MAPKYLNEDDLWAAPKTAVQKPQYLNETDLFPPPGVGDYAKEAGKAFVQGAKDLPGTALQGVDVATAPEKIYGTAPNPYDLAAAGDPDFAEAFIRGPQQAATRESLSGGPLFQAGAAIKDFGREELAPGPGFEKNSWTRDISGGAGSLLAGVGVSLLSPSAAMLMFAGAGQGEAVERAMASGATPEQVQNAARWGTAAGATDVVDALLPRLGTAGRVGGFIKRVGLPAIGAALAEGGQEALQQLIQNAIAKNIYKPDQDLDEGVLRNFAVGAIIGGGVKGIQNSLTRPTPSTTPELEELRLAAAAMGPQPVAVPGTAKKVMTLEELEAIMNDQKIPRVPGASTTIASGPNAVTAATPDPWAMPPELAGKTGTQLVEDQLATMRRGEVPVPPADFNPSDGRDMLLPWNNIVVPGSSVQPTPMPLEGEVLPPLAKPEEQMSPKVVDFLARKDKPLEIPEGPIGFSDLLAANKTMAEEATKKRYPLSEEEPMKTIVSERLNFDGVGTDAFHSQDQRLEINRTYGKYKLVTGKTFELLSEPEALGLLELWRGNTRQSARSNAAMREEATITQGRPGANTGRLARLLGPKLYGDPSNMTSVTVKEILQNSFDGIKGIIQKDSKFEGNIDIALDDAKRTIIVKDNGTGMTPQVLGKEFLEIAGTKKESDRASGGLGIAKMMFLFGNKRMNVITARDGKISTMSTTGEDLFTALEDPSAAPQISTRTMTAEDRKSFPQGHGTMIEVEVPKSFKDPATGEERNIDFDGSWTYPHPVLERSPLFDNINVNFNGKPLPIGKSFPLADYTQFVNVNFDWGTARVYVTQNPNDAHTSYRDNMHVLSNGLWQFSDSLTKDGQKYGPKIPRTFYIDVQSKVRPEDAGYPFDLNRQQFSPGVQKDFQKIFNYARLVFQQADHNVSVENFGTMQFLDFDMETKTVKSSGEKKLVPPERTTNAATALQGKGETVEVRDGKLYVAGREIPELSSKDLDDVKIDVSKLKIPQSEIDPNAIILHDNTSVPATGTPLDQMAMQRPKGEFDQVPFEGPPGFDVDPIVDDGMPKIPLSQLAADRFGGRFYEYTFLMGAHFRQLRDIIAGYPVNEPATSTGLKTYAGLKTEGIGISFDPEYRGVSIRLPFAASFLNIAIPVNPSTPATSAVGMVQTMIHELAHHVHRSEKGLAPVMQDLWTQLALDPNFNFQKFMQRTINTVASYNDVFQFLNGAYQNGLVTTGGKRFDDGVGQRTDGGGVGDNGVAALGEPGGHRLADWSALGQSATGRGDGRADAGASVAGAGTSRDPSFGKNSNQRALNDAGDPGVEATQKQEELLPSRQAIGRLFGGSTPKPVAQMAAHADRMNWVYKWWAGITQLRDANPNHGPLIGYTEQASVMHGDEAKIQDIALRIGKDWRNLGKQAENLTSFLHDLQLMTYLSPQEVAANVERNPTVQERQALFGKHKLSSEAIRVAVKIDGLFKLFIDQIVGVQIENGIRGMTDMSAIQTKIGQITLAGQKLKDRPYFPFMNFGRHYLQVKNAAGDVVEFTTFERSGLRSAERVQMAAVKKAEEFVKSRGLGETIHHGILPETGEQFVGMPPQLLDAIKTNLGLTPVQLKALDTMRIQSQASISFRQRFSNRTVVPGYSMDFQRSFAKYFFHGARYFARTKHKPKLQMFIDAAKQMNGNKASKVAEYMEDHLQNAILDARGDFGILKGAIFLWAMGYVPAAAFVNLSQTPMITYPFLWGKFGNIAASKALVRANFVMKNFMKKGTYEGMVNAGSTNFEIKAIAYGLQSGRISETQSADLAGLAQGEGLIKGIGGNRASQATVMFQEKAAWMFEMAEQYNRRIAYSAGLYLGQTRPNSKEVQVAIKKYQQEFLELQQKNFTPAEAKAIVTAIHTVDQTQYVYARYARARAMRGPIGGVLFVFQQYKQSTLMLAAHNKSDVLPRMMIMWALLGGLSGLAGWEDAREVIKGAARRWYGKDFDIEKELRKAIMDYTNSEVGADIALHGFARKGFGVPAILDLMGSYFTGTPGRGLTSNQVGSNVPAPSIDMSRAISMGQILPFSPGKLISPHNVNSAIAEETQRASGAAVSVGFNIYKSLNSQKDWTDFKRYEPMVPRALAATSRMFRSHTEQRERTNFGGENTAPTVVNYDNKPWTLPKDIRDTEHLMEQIAVGMGFQTERLSTKWEATMGRVEIERFYEAKKKGLLAQLHEAVKGGIEQEREDMVALIRRHNEGLPDYARGYAISNETARKSLETRERLLNQAEAGVPAKKAAVPVQQYIDSLYPSVPTDMRRVR